MKKQFKPTDKSIIAETIGRDCAKEFTQRTPPQFDVDLKTSRTPFVAFMHSMSKTCFKTFKI